MIVITGPGRSGTSVLAELYRELGFDPSGTWDEAVHAGFEDREVVDVNRRIAHRLGITTHVGRSHPALHKLAASRLPGRSLAARVLLARTRAGVGRIDRAAMPVVVAELGSEMRRLAASRAVVKDPTFLYTLGAWGAAAAAVDAVVLTMRSMDAVVASRAGAGLRRNLSDAALGESLAFGVGLCTFAAVEHDLPLTMVRFPDFLDDVEGLHRALPFPSPVELPRFEEAFQRVVARENVRFGR